MTEDEAKTKWCPAARSIPATESHHAFDNRGDVFDPMRSPGLCIASACMAWRKFRDRDLGGFCGLAGPLP